MNRFVYVSADKGIPLPGTKGASIHVRSVVSELEKQGYTGQVLSTRVEGGNISNTPLVDIRRELDVRGTEEKQFLGNCRSLEGKVIGKPNFVLERYSLWHVGGLALARDLNCPFILEVNSPLPLEAQQYRSLEQPELAQGVAKLLMREADGIVCVSAEVAQWVTELRGGFGKNTNAVWTIPNGFDDSLFRQVTREHAETRERPTIMFCGTFREWHGIENLIDAFEILTYQHELDAELLLIGDGPLREELELRVRSRQLDSRVTFTGKVEHYEVPSIASGATIAVAPYPKMENFYFSPLKIYEHMGMGLPVVASAVGQIPQMLAEGRGVLCEPGNPMELATHLAELIGDSQRCESVGSAALEWAHQNATWGVRVEHLLQQIGRLE